MGDPNAFYSEPIKPKKSSTPTGIGVNATEPISLEGIEVGLQEGATSEGVATEDSRAVYAQPIKRKKSS